MKKIIFIIVCTLVYVSTFAQRKSSSDIDNDFWRTNAVQILKEKVTDAATFNADGENTSVGTTLEDINNTNASLAYPLVSHRAKIVSTSANDVTGGTGIRRVTIYGLNANWENISATLIMAGTDSVKSATTIKFIRIFKAVADSVGSNGSAVGTVKVVTNESDTLQAQIDIGYTQSFNARWSVPAASYGYVKSIYTMSGVASKANTVYLYAREFGKPWKRIFPMQTNGSAFNYEFGVPYEFGAKSDIEIRALSAGGSGSMTAGFSGWYDNGN